MSDDVDTTVGFAGTLEVHIPVGTGRGYTDLTLTANTVDWQAEEYFGRYHCHWLASALGGLTGWQQAVFEVREPDGTWKPVHSGVLAPTGRVLDIFGERAPAEVERFYSEGHQGRPVRHRVLAPAEMPGEVITGVDEHRGDPHWWARELPEPGRAAYLGFARHVLDRTGYHRHPDAPAPARQAEPVRARMGQPVKITDETVTVSGFGATCRRGLTTVELQPDRITEEARELFGHRQCVLLAVELHRRTGWPLVLTDRQDPEEGWTWAHAAVRHPSGDLVDIDGRRSEQQLMADRNADGYTDPQRVRDIGTEDALRAALNVHPDMAGPAWHTSAAGFPATYGPGVVARLAAAVLAEHELTTHQPGPAIPHQPTASEITAADTATTGGTDMGIEEIRAGIAQAEQTVEGATQTLQQAHHQVAEAISVLAQILQGSDASEAAEAIGALQSTDDLFEQLRGQLAQGVESAVGYARRL